jgi:SAM-dependent methyltransferase
VGHESGSGIAAYYDNLSRFLDFAGFFGRGGGASQSTTHRFLAASDGGEAAPEQLDCVVLQAALDAGLPAAPRVLDAGCGLGGTIFRWQERLGGRYDGFTLSPEQRRRAEVTAVQRGIADTCRFHLRSYQDPIVAGALASPYHAIVAIESLAHSQDPTATIANLGAALAPGGLLLIVDDMPDDMSNFGTRRILAAFKECWRCPVLAGASAYRDKFTAAGLALVYEEDLTGRLRPRPALWLKVLIGGFGLAHALAPTQGLRNVLDAIRGGFMLEALYRAGEMHYRLLVAVRPAP